MLWQNVPVDTGNDARFRQRMRAAKQIGANSMTARVIQDINKEKQLLAEPTPIDIKEWDTMVCDDPHGNVAAIGTPLVPYTQPQSPPTGESTPAEQPSGPTEPDLTTRTPHKTKTKGHNGTPKKAPGQVSPHNKKKKPDSRSSDKPKQQMDKAGFAVGETKGKDRSKPPKKS